MDFRILGPLEIVQEGAPLVLPTGPQQRALLLYLLLHANEVVSTERLIDAVWEGEPPATAAKIVQLYVSQWRKSVDGRLVTRAPGYLLRVEEGELDSDRAAALAARARDAPPAEARELVCEALDLWRGQPLTDATYHGFAQAEVARLEELRLALLEQRFAAELELGRHDDLVPELESLVRAHPLRERLRAQLMVALYRAGRQADALEVFRDARTRLVDELGLEPGETLQQLQRAILEHDPKLAPPRRRPEILQERILRRPRYLAAAGAILVLGAVLAGAFELLGGDDAARVPVAANSVVRVDGRDGRLRDVVHVGVRPVAVESGAGAVWTANADDGTVSRVDEATRKVRAIGIGSDVADIAIGFGSVWVADGNASAVTRIDSRQSLVEATISLGESEPLVSQPVFVVATGAGAVWASHGDRVARIDPATNTVVREFAVPRLLGLAVTRDAVWVTTRDERLVRLDPKSGRSTGEIHLGGEAPVMEVGGGSLWLLVRPASRPFQLWRINPRTVGVISSESTGSYPSSLVYADGSVWLADPGTAQLVRFDPEAGRAVAAIELGHWPTGVAASGDEIWVSVRTS